MTEIEKVTNNQAKARSIYNSLIKDNIFYTGISKNLAIALIELGIDSSTTDKLSVEKLQEELESCIQTLIEASVAANITQDIVVGNLVDRKLADLAKTHKLAVDYIEKVTGKNIDVVLAENAALEAEEEG
ncbi:hypothetical protein OGZ44_08495 [Lactococcus lactis]|uniref:hypothetical protein n=1 Tax=Lactococcus lactis TaxID=1358 RepID=UPI0024163E3A|nr:hypothetical protein [Lactococcus lactis]MDG4974283.1 hypothetical protein [Lactococcus lactis]